MRSHDAIPPGPHDADDEPHDVLAAEEFAMPAAPSTRPGRPLILPPNPAGDDDEPHDILAAEEFPMPAPTARVVFAPSDH